MRVRKQAKIRDRYDQLPDERMLAPSGVHKLTL